MPKKNTPEWRALQTERIQRKKEITESKKTDRGMFADEQTPIFCSAMIFGAALPQSALAYLMVWNDACSDIFI